MLGIAAALVGSAPLTASATSGSARLIPRRVLLAPTEREWPRLSPDGNRIVWLANNDGVRNLWVAPALRPDSGYPLTEFRDRGLLRTVSPHWSMDGRCLIVGRDNRGDENIQLLAIDARTGAVQPLTSAGARAGLVKLSPKAPNHALISTNARDRRLFDAVLVDLRDGTASVVMQNEGFVDFWADSAFRVRLGVKRNEDGGHSYFQATENGAWTFLSDVAPEDVPTTGPLGYSADGSLCYWRDSRGRDTAALVAIKADGSSELLAEDPDADIDVVEFHPRSGVPIGWRSTRERPHWQASSPELAAELHRLFQIDPGDVGFMNRSADNSRALVWFNRDAGPARFHLWDRTKAWAPLLFLSSDRLSGLDLVPMRPLTLRSRDGYKLVSYLSLPRGPAASLPMVVLVHGGPWSRDSWGFDPAHQLLANRGYAVLSVNFRGSTGFGKSFIAAGNGQWGRRMQDDLLDAVDWAVAIGIADPARLAIMGASYGGYAALAGLAFTPERFACGIAAAAIADLPLFLKSMPAYWQPNAALWHLRMGGDLATAAGRALLKDRSPSTHVDRITRPLLLGHGDRDPRVAIAVADHFAAKLQQRGSPLIYARFLDEGHSFQRPANRHAWWALVEAFLARHLGGQAEAPDADLSASSLSVVYGADQVPEIAGQLSQR